MKLISLLVVLILLSGWFMNIVKLVNLDFEPNYKAEIIRSVGITVVPVGMISGWVTIEEEED